MSGFEISAENVSKIYGDLPVLTQVDLQVKAGEFIVIIGKSGCGKSTLLRLIAGLEKTTGGEIHYGSDRLSGIHPQAKMMFQDHRLLPWQTVGENVELGIRAKGQQTAANALSLVGLEDKMHEWPAVLSGGQKQRVSLARALASSPHLLLLDEPLGALDALTRLEMQRLIEKLWKEQQFTAILVTHDVSEAVMLGDRVILVENGEVSMDLRIDLQRPRKIDEKFAQYQNNILARLMNEREE
ncbi:ATP-binding cassette domain-containing protein [Bacillus infantis]|uniref:ABC transporter ATP-binding protein n=1 Tax=Bacillus infantis TaxID=324767 RepID=UPI0039823F68